MVASAPLYPRTTRRISAEGSFGSTEWEASIFLLLDALNAKICTSSLVTDCLLVPSSASSSWIVRLRQQRWKCPTLPHLWHFTDLAWQRSLLVEWEAKPQRRHAPPTRDEFDLAWVSVDFTWWIVGVKGVERSVKLWDWDFRAAFWRTREHAFSHVRLLASSLSSD